MDSLNKVNNSELTKNNIPACSPFSLPSWSTHNLYLYVCTVFHNNQRVYLYRIMYLAHHNKHLYIKLVALRFKYNENIFYIVQNFT